MNIGKHCGEWCYNNGYARKGVAKEMFSFAFQLCLTPISVPLFSIGFDNGWVAASK